MEHDPPVAMATGAAALLLRVDGTCLLHQSTHMAARPSRKIDLGPVIPQLEAHNSFTPY